MACRVPWLLRLVGGVTGEKLAAQEQVIDQSRREMPVRPRPQKHRAFFRVEVALAQTVQGLHQVRLGQGRRQIQRRLETQRVRDAVEQLLQLLNADGREHVPDIGGRVRNIAHG